MRGVCELLDTGDSLRPYTTALDVQAAKVHEPSLTPSARTLHELRTTGESFFQFALRMSAVHKAYFLELHSPNEALQDAFAARGRGVAARAGPRREGGRHRFRGLPGAVFRCLSRIRANVRHRTDTSRCYAEIAALGNGIDSRHARNARPRRGKAKMNKRGIRRQGRAIRSLAGIVRGLARRLGSLRGLAHARQAATRVGFASATVGPRRGQSRSSPVTSRPLESIARAACLRN
jgi:hypothetical protein